MFLLINQFLELFLEVNQTPVRLRVNLTHIQVSAASLWDSAICFKQDKFLHEMNPGIFIELQVTNIILTGILLLCMLYVLMWLIFFTGPS